MLFSMIFCKGGLLQKQFSDVMFLLGSQVGSTVEVRSPEGGLTEAVINKLTDASWYTVGTYRHS